MHCKPILRCYVAEQPCEPKTQIAAVRGNLVVLPLYRKSVTPPSLERNSSLYYCCRQMWCVPRELKAGSLQGRFQQTDVLCLGVFLGPQLLHDRCRGAGCCSAHPGMLLRLNSLSSSWTSCMRLDAMHALRKSDPHSSNYTRTDLIFWVCMALRNQSEIAQKPFSHVHSQALL